MSNLLESLLVEISADAPSGADLEYDPEFARMEKASQETPDQDFGSTHIEGTPADWETVRDAALDLLSRSHDLRVATYLAHAELVLNGLPGFRDVLQLIAGYIEKFWETVYPRLDEDDDNDPTSRINALAGLNRPGGTIRQVKMVPILRSRSVGNMSWTDVAIARGEIPVPEGMEDPPTTKKVESAVKSSTLQDVTSLYEAVEQSIDSLSRIENGFSDRLGFGSIPNLELLSKELKGIARFQKGWLEQLRADQPAEAVVEDRGLISVSSDEAPALQQARAVQVFGAASLAIGRREDAIEALDKIIAWFERFEPSSPLPMLLRRAKRLSTMSFLDILRDISPGGLDQAVLVGGKEATQDDDEVRSSSSKSKSDSESHGSDDDY